MKPALFSATDGTTTVEQFSCHEGIGKRLRNGANCGIPDGTARFSPDEYLRSVRDGLERIAGGLTADDWKSLVAFAMEQQREARRCAA